MSVQIFIFQDTLILLLVYFFLYIILMLMTFFSELLLISRRNHFVNDYFLIVDKYFINKCLVILFPTLFRCNIHFSGRIISLIHESSSTSAHPLCHFLRHDNRVRNHFYCCSVVSIDTGAISNHDHYRHFQTNLCAGHCVFVLWL